MKTNEGFTKSYLISIILECVKYRVSSGSMECGVTTYRRTMGSVPYHMNGMRIMYEACRPIWYGIVFIDGLIY